MLIGQVGVAFALWLVYGFVLARKSKPMRAKLLKIDRKVRIALGPIIMIVGAVIMLLGVGFVAAINGLRPNGLTPAGWLILTLVGAAFVHSQVLAALTMLTVAIDSEPECSHETSDGRITDRKSNDS
jgi:protein-S-isoprenylcysteine O-methyltransferase Ste14